MIRKCIPNTITLLNLFCGCLSVVAALEGHMAAAGLFIIAAAVFDFFDGFAARLLHVQSELGKQLDSLADVVSFGVAPSAVVYVLMQESVNLPDLTVYGHNPLPFLAFVMALFSALRLAKFNIDTRQSYGFIGLPTPANALMTAALPLMLWQYAGSTSLAAQVFGSLLENFYVLSAYTIIMSYLLISELPMMAFKFRSAAFKGNEMRYGFALFALLVPFVFYFAAIPLIIIFYIFLSLITAVYHHKSKRHDQ